ncbi:hypothetical protein BME96_10355 [Virgibacillus halodenitrificans]|uniref:Uncharacterized protein n=1 Tax=Virgibacillus halodenitrificans TaxID=1482 RepID=A0AAC9IZU8_VIRHA|nr:hypothetical protein BME96_10355 [Virgibacillus halodenitrificans]
MWCKRETIQWAFKAEAGNIGFQPQSKPPVHTGGFDCKVKREFFINIVLVFFLEKIYLILGFTKFSLKDTCS